MLQGAALPLSPGYVLQAVALFTLPSGTYRAIAFSLSPGRSIAAYYFVGGWYARPREAEGFQALASHLLRYLENECPGAGAVAYLDRWKHITKLISIYQAEHW